MTTDTNRVRSEKIRVLAEDVMGWKEDVDADGVGYWYGPGVDGPQSFVDFSTPCGSEDPWDPFTNRNDLAEVLERLNKEQNKSVYREVTKHRTCPDLISEYTLWLLTCDPAIIADAVAEVVRGEKQRPVCG